MHSWNYGNFHLPTSSNHWFSRAMLVSGRVDETRLNVKCPSPKLKAKKPEVAFWKGTDCLPMTNFQLWSLTLHFETQMSDTIPPTKWKVGLLGLSFSFHSSNSLKPSQLTYHTSYINWTTNVGWWYIELGNQIPDIDWITHALTGFKTPARLDPFCTSRMVLQNIKYLWMPVEKSTTCMMLRIFCILKLYWL